MFDSLINRTAPVTSHDENVESLIKALLIDAVDHHANKIVFGTPCEDGYERVPFAVERLLNPVAPSEFEEATRVTECSEKELSTERAAGIRKGYAALVPIWFRNLNAYEELPGVPMALFLDILAVLNVWNGSSVSWSREKISREAKLLAPLNKASKVPSSLSNFLLDLPKHRTVHVALAFEATYCLALWIRDAGGGSE
jgi:hypothetical protein